MDSKIGIICKISAKIASTLSLRHLIRNFAFLELQTFKNRTPTNAKLTLFLYDEVTDLMILGKIAKDSDSLHNSIHTVAH